MLTENLRAEKEEHISTSVELALSEDRASFADEASSFKLDIWLGSPFAKLLRADASSAREIMRSMPCDRMHSAN